MSNIKTLTLPQGMKKIDEAHVRRQFSKKKKWCGRKQSRHFYDWNEEDATMLRSVIGGMKYLPHDVCKQEWPEFDYVCCSRKFSQIMNVILMGWIRVVISSLMCAFCFYEDADLFILLYVDEILPHSTLSNSSVITNTTCCTDEHNSHTLRTRNKMSTLSTRILNSHFATQVFLLHSEFSSHCQCWKIRIAKVCQTGSLRHCVGTHVAKTQHCGEPSSS